MTATPHQGVLTTCASDDSTRRDREGRRLPTVIDCLQTGVGCEVDLTHVAPVGRLDADSEGLLLCTNDGSLARGLLMPGACAKVYFAAISLRGAYLSTDDDTRQAFSRSAAALETTGVQLKGGLVGRAEEATLASGEEAAAVAVLMDGPPSAGTVLCKIVMRHGAKRVVRRMLRAAGFNCHRLCRTSIGGVSLAQLKLQPGQSVALHRADIAVLYGSMQERNLRELPPVYDSDAEQWVPASHLAAALQQEPSERR